MSSPVKQLPRWSDCRRCSRWQHREGVVAPKWPGSCSVLLLDEHMPVDCQILGELPPRLLRARTLLVSELGMSEKEVALDALCACGVAPDPTPDEVAACAARLSQRAPSQLKLVGFVRERALSLARQAGLVRNDQWHPHGSYERAPTVLVEDLDRLPQVVAQYLGRTPPPPKKTAVACTSALLRALPQHDRYRILRPTDGEWKTHRGPLTTGLVRQHLKGRLWVGPDSPTEHWNYVVLDVDVHGALQRSKFTSTLGKLKSHFRNACFVQSSSSGGVHVYLRLPPGVKYGRAVLRVRAYLNLKGLRWVAHDKLIAEAVEVPRQPPRLPFGAGSFLLNSTDDIGEQCREFINYITTAPTTYYERIVEEVDGKVHWGASRRFTPAVGRRLRELAEAQYGGEAAPVLEPGDPWNSVVHNLSEAERTIATRGVVAYGTRFADTKRLVDALTDLVPEGAAVTLMGYWLNNRNHASKDIASRPQLTYRETMDLVRRAYKYGLPERAWRGRGISYDVIQAYFAHPRVHQFRVSSVLKTAFYIAKKFYVVGVSERSVTALEFERFTGKNTAREVRAILTRGNTWLVQCSSPVPGQKATGYRLIKYWPLRPGERVLHQP